MTLTYEPRTIAGRWGSTAVHAVPVGTTLAIVRAACGTLGKEGKLELGWSPTNRRITCSVCWRVLRDKHPEQFRALKEKEAA